MGSMDEAALGAADFGTSALRWPQGMVPIFRESHNGNYYGVVIYT